MKCCESLIFLFFFQSIYTNPIPEPTLEVIAPLIAQGATAAAALAYGGALGSGFPGRYPYNAGVVPYNNGFYNGGGQFYGGGVNPYYYGRPYY